MAEKDPCESVLPEEAEEEVSPEYQETSPARFGIPGIGPSASDLSNPMSGILQPAALAGTSAALESVVESMQNETVQQVMKDIESERVQQVLSGDLGEGLENDVSLTPVFQNRLSAEKSTWVITNSSLLDFGTTYDRNGGQERFLSKPGYLLGLYPFFDEYRSPSNLIDNQYRIDPLRWIGDRMWFNSTHIDGPDEFQNPTVARQAHLKSNGPELYFINSAKGFGKNWALLYLDAQKRLEIRSGGGYNRSRWKNLDQAMTSINSSNTAGFKVKYEHHEIVGTKPRHSRQDWSWKDYFYGNVKSEIVSDVVGATGGTPSSRRESYRELAKSSDNNVGWRSINQKYSVPSNHANLNPFPVIPFYGDGYALNANTDPSRLDSPPTVGRIMFEDFTTNITDLLTKEESDVVDIGNKSFFDIRTVYSYFDCLYERIFSPVLDELEMPSPYLKKPELAFEASSLRTGGLSRIQREDYDNLIFSRLEIADLITGTNHFSGNRSRIDRTEATRPSRQTEYVENLIQIGNRDAKRKIAELMKDYYGFNIENDDPDVYLSNRTPEELDVIYNERYLNPMFVEMEFGSVEKSQLAEAMTLNGDNTIVRSMFSALVRRRDTETRTRRSYLSGKNINIRNTNIINASYVDQMLQSGVNSFSDSLDTSVEFSDTIKIEEALSLDFSEWFDSVFDFYTSGILAPTSPIEKFANIFRLLSIRAKVARFANSRSRSYAQIMSGVPAKSEVLGFTIDKYEISRNGEETYINSFHILSNNDREVERFIDSQVKYNKVYEYKINRIVAIVGNKYAYIDPGQVQSEKEKQKEDNTKPQPGSAEFTQKFGIVNVPVIKIISVPSTSKRVAVSDRPPIYPNIDFIPFKNVQNKVLINLSSNTGEYLAPPVLLEDDDNVQFYVVAASQGLPSVQNISLQQARDLSFSLSDDLAESEMIRFRSDDPATTFEVFRTDKYPKNYEDFVGNKIIKKKMHSDNYSLVDKLVPNKKYYYTFRTEDVHGHVSNPSHIYEVQLVTLNEAVRLVVNIVEPEDLAQKKKNMRESLKELRIFMSIRPNISQRTLQLPESGKFDDLVKLGENNEMFGDEGSDKLWGKKFKLRIKSKSTGKEVDVNFRFNAKVKKNEQNKKVNLIC